MARPQGMTCCEQLTKLHRVAELLGALLVELPKGKYPGTQAYVSRYRLKEIEDALCAAGYDMPAVRERYKQLTSKGQR